MAVEERIQKNNYSWVYEYLPIKKEVNQMGYLKRIYMWLLVTEMQYFNLQWTIIYLQIVITLIQNALFTCIGHLLPIHRFDFDYSFLQKSNPFRASSACSLLPNLAKRYLQQLNKGKVDPRLERGVEMVFPFTLGL